jgi:hypothetical protein
LFYCKIFFASRESSKGRCIKNGVNNIDIFHTIFSKMLFLSIFLVF